MMAFSGVTSECEERGFRRSAGTNFEIAIAVVPGRRCTPSSESIAPWDYYKIRRIIPAQEAAQPLAQSKCAPIGDHFRQKRLVEGGVRA